MKRSRSSEEQVAYSLRLAEADTPVVDVCRQMGIAEATFYLWKKKYASLGASAASPISLQWWYCATTDALLSGRHGQTTHI